METYERSPTSGLFSPVQRNNLLVAAGQLDTGAGAYRCKVPASSRSFADVQRPAAQGRWERVGRLRGCRPHPADFQGPGRASPASTAQPAHRPGDLQARWAPTSSRPSSRPAL
ncbi:MAG: hypothetical protein U5L11_08300 [Arhodomonas sp.]|nr:hypothetical protein [Arhodomonas sp.]